MFTASEDPDYSITMTYDISSSNITGYNPDYSNKVATNPVLLEFKYNSSSSYSQHIYFADLCKTNGA